jgi:hypothetical protein
VHRAAFARSALLDEAAVAELRAFTAEFERRLAETLSVESVPPAVLRAAS